jgi:hypothetical protein
LGGISLPRIRLHPLPQLRVVDGPLLEGEAALGSRSNAQADLGRLDTEGT